MIPGLDARLDELGCRALLVVASSSRDPSLSAFFGKTKVGECFLLAPRARRPLLGFLSPMERVEAAAAAARAGFDLLTPDELDAPRLARSGAKPERLWLDVLGQAFLRAGLNPCRLALAGSAPNGRVRAVCAGLEREGFEFLPGEDLVARASRAKGPVALEQIRRVSNGVAATFRHVAGLLAAAAPDAEGLLRLGPDVLTVGLLRAEIAGRLAGCGLEQPEGQIVAPAEEGAVPHSTGTDERPLRAGESLIVDLYPRDVFFSDCTRTFCVGAPPAELVRAFEDCRHALRLAEERTRAGVRAFSVQQAVCDWFKSQGWPTQVHDPGTTRGYVHGLGHGLGVEVHSLPSFREFAAEEDGLLVAGDVLTLEPGLYEPEPGKGWAVRLENLYLLRDDGLESFFDLPLALDPRAWNTVV